MPTKDRYHKDNIRAAKRMLSAEDKAFVRLLGEGVPRPEAFRRAYPNHKNVQKYMDLKDNRGTKEFSDIAQRVRQHAKDKALTKHINTALVTYQRKMETFSDLSLNTAIDLVQNARSEKVRADLAIEGIRHQVGTPVQKVAVQQKKTVTLSFDKPKDASSAIIDMELGDEPT